MTASSFTFTFRGRKFAEHEIAKLSELITAHPTASRRRLSWLACEMLDWRQENGHPRDMLCRSAMLALHRAGRITLPPARSTSLNNALRHREIEPLHLYHDPVEASLAALGPIEVRQVRRTKDEPTVNGLIQAYHYLGYTRPVGESLKYFFLAQGAPIACAAWSSAPRHLGLRDRFIGWSKEARRVNLRRLAYNTRFLILPWVKVPHLASHLLGRMARRISKDWQDLYGHDVLYLESFTDPSRFKGTCYRAANWVFLGRTSGRGNNAPTHTPRVPIKEILGLPLDRRFRQILGDIP